MDQIGNYIKVVTLDVIIPHEISGVWTKGEGAIPHQTTL
jgi:hypothetical protein